MTPVQIHTLIHHLGGTSAAARLFGVKPQSIVSWRKKGVPAARIQTLQALAITQPAIAKALRKAGVKLLDPSKPTA